MGHTPTGPAQAARRRPPNDDGTDGNMSPKTINFEEKAP